MNDELPEQEFVVPEESFDLSEVPKQEHKFERRGPMAVCVIHPGQHAVFVGESMPKA